MTMLFIDGMDHYNGATSVRYRWRGGVEGGGVITSSGIKRFTNSNASMLISNDDIPVSASWHPYTPRHNIFVSFYRSGWGQETDQMFRFKEGPVTHIMLRTVEHSHQIQVYLGEFTTFLVQSTPCIYQVEAFDLIECYVSLSDAVSEGRVELRVNNVVVAEFDGDTRNGGFNTGLDSIEFVGELANSYFDDICVYDDLGSENNDFIGDFRIQTVWVDGEAEAAWDNPVDTDENYKQIDDQGAGAGATHVMSQTTGAKDRYTVDALSVNAESPDNVEDVLSVQVTHLARRPDAGTRDMIQIIESNGSERRSDENGINPMNTDWQRFSFIADLDPDGDIPWTEASVAAMTIGQEAGS